MKVKYYKWVYQVFGKIEVEDSGRVYYRVLIDGEPTLLNSWNSNLEVL